MSNSKVSFQHKALRNYNPLTGEYDETQEINPNGILVVDGKYEVCSRCDGHGTHFRSDLDENHMVDMLEDDCDYEGLEEYHNGSFDQMCEECKGKRVVFNPILPEWADKRIADWYEYQMQSERERNAERRVGA
jgi:hypothetical protein